MFDRSSKTNLEFVYKNGIFIKIIYKLLSIKLIGNSAKAFKH